MVEYPDEWWRGDVKPSLWGKGMMDVWPSAFPSNKQLMSQWNVGNNFWGVGPWQPVHLFLVVKGEYGERGDVSVSIYVLVCMYATNKKSTAVKWMASDFGIFKNILTFFINVTFLFVLVWAKMLTNKKNNFRLVVFDSRDLNWALLSGSSTGAPAGSGAPGIGDFTGCPENVCLVWSGLV